MPNNIENESKVIQMESVSTVEPLLTPIPGDIPPVPTIETEPTAERLPSKKTRFSAKKELENLKKEFEDYKARVERLSLIHI